jgi:hypothetical protein
MNEYKYRCFKNKDMEIRRIIVRRYQEGDLLTVNVPKEAINFIAFIASEQDESPMKSYQSDEPLYFSAKTEEEAKNMVEVYLRKLYGRMEEIG